MMILNLYIYPVLVSLFLVLCWRVTLLYLLPYTYHHNYVGEMKVQMNMETALWALSPVLNLAMPLVLIKMMIQTYHGLITKNQYHTEQCQTEEYLRNYYKELGFRESFPHIQSP